MLIHGFRNQQNVPAKNYNCNVRVTDNGKREPLRSARPLVSAMLPSFKYPQHQQFSGSCSTKALLEEE
jgi:hypothetical protein